MRLRALPGRGCNRLPGPAGSGSPGAWPSIFDHANVHSHFLFPWGQLRVAALGWQMIEVNMFGESDLVQAQFSRPHHVLVYAALRVAAEGRVHVIIG